MSSLRIEEKFTVPAPVERVWRFLLDPVQVAGCLPGARLDGSDGAGTFTGTMKVKVGPVTTEFRGKATFVEVDEAGRRMRLTGTGDDKAGGGSARMSMEGRVLAAADGGSEVTVTADVELAGKLVRFGRGMIEGVSKQLFKQFAERARTQLAAPAPDAPAPAAAASEPEPAPAAEPTAAAAPTPPPATAEPASAAPAPSAATPTPAATEPAKGPPPAPADAPSTELAPAAPTALAAAAPMELAPVAPSALAAAAPMELAPVAPSALAAAAPMELAPVAPSALVPAAPTALAPAAPSALAPAAPTALAPAAPSALAPAKKDDEVLDAGALIWTVLWERITRFFRRLFGRGG
ncbi:MAG: SRPBCC family protein [Polyangia bacterium]